MSHISPSGRRANTVRLEEVSLSTSRPQPVIQIAAGGALLKVQGPLVPLQGHQTWTRGVVTRFTAASRKRLLEVLASINQKEVIHKPLFITLTYPSVYPSDPAIYKSHLDTWLKRLGRRYPEAAAVWRLEFQKRGAPHFHLLVFGLRWVDKKWLSKSWAEVVDSGDKRHEKAGTQVERVKSWRGVMWYASKYMAKKTDGAPVVSVGRWWGVYNRKALPIQVISFAITLRQFWRFKRTARRWRSQVRRSTISNVWCRGFSLFTPASRAVALFQVLLS